MNANALKDLRDYHQRIITGLHKTIADRVKGTRREEVPVVSENERFLLRDHERFVSALDEVLAATE